MSLILVVEPDSLHAARFQSMARTHLRAELVMADSADHAVAALAHRVPDIVLTGPLLPGHDEEVLSKYWRALGDAAAHVQTLTIPILSAAATAPERTMLGRFRRERPKTDDNDGCDPAMFADQIGHYLKRARQSRGNLASQQAPAAAPTPATAPTPVYIPTPAAAATPAHVPTPAAAATPIYVPTPAAAATPVYVPTPAAAATPVYVPTPAAAAAPEPLPLYVPPPTPPAPAVAPASFAPSYAPMAVEEVVEEEFTDEVASVLPAADELEADRPVFYAADHSTAGADADFDDDARESADEAIEIEAVGEDVDLSELLNELSAPSLPPVSLSRMRYQPAEPPRHLPASFDREVLVPAVLPRANDTRRRGRDAASNAGAQAKQPLPPVNDPQPSQVQQHMITIPSGNGGHVQASVNVSVAVAVQVSASTSVNAGPAGPAMQRRPRAPKPVQDEWGFFDPDQCGFRALIARLDAIAEVEDTEP